MDKKLKIKPSLRENKRYLMMSIWGGREDAIEEIKKAIKDFLGSFGYDKANPKFIQIEEKEGKAEIILAVNREELDNIRAAICLAKRQIVVRRVSGTLKKLRQ